MSNPMRGRARTWCAAFVFDRRGRSGMDLDNRKGAIRHRPG